MLLNSLQRRRLDIASVSTQMLVYSLWCIESIDHHTIEYNTYLRALMAIRACHDDRQQDATSA